MKNFLSVMLATSALLATFMLQLSDSSSPNAAFIGSVSILTVLAGMYFVDIRGLFHLSELWSNTLIIIVVLCHLGGLLNSPTAFLAYSIANILAYVQMILFYRKKTSRIYFQIVTLSFLQVCVGCVSDQGVLFAGLLLLYSFTIVCVLTLLFITQEKQYYEKHAFLRPAIGRDTKKTKGTRHLIGLALRTFFMTPFFLLFGFKEEDYETFLTKQREGNRQKSFSNRFQEWIERIRHDFITAWNYLRRNPVHSNGTFETNRRNLDTGTSVKKGNGTKSDIAFGYWESADGDLSLTGPHQSSFITSSEQSRFPMLYRSPVFSGTSPGGKVPSVTWRLFTQMIGGAAFSLVLALLLFFVFPRFQKIEIGDIRLGHDGWRTSQGQANSAVGFSETIQLGDLGPSRNNFQPVMTVRFVDVLREGADRIGPGTNVYFRGVTLIKYLERQWSRLPAKFTSPATTSNITHVEKLDEDFFEPAYDREEELEPQKMGPRRVELSFFGRNRRRFFTTNHANFPSPFYQMGHVFPANTDDYLMGIFDPVNNLFCQEIELNPFSSPIVFSVWPFFRVESNNDGGFFDEGWFVRTGMETFRQTKFSLYTNAFRGSRQVDLIPNQENIESRTKLFLQINKKDLPGLCLLATQWDAASGLEKDDYIGRAKNLERMLRESGNFRYSMGIIRRNRHLDPLEDFVTEHRQGHCEFFAGSLVMMLRAVNIPSRIVIGFKTTVNPSSSGYHTVRQSDAHSWVEAYIPKKSLKYDTNRSKVIYPSVNPMESYWWENGAWLRLDATPSADETVMGTVSKNYRSWTVSLRDIWSGYILNYGNSRQKSLVYDPCKELYTSVRDKIQQGTAFQAIQSFFQRTVRFFSNLAQGQWDTREFVSIFIPLAISVVLIYVLFRLLKHMFRHLSWSRNPFFASSAVRVAFYARLEAFLARSGLKREPSETPKQFIVRCLDDPRFDDFIRRVFFGIHPKDQNSMVAPEKLERAKYYIRTKAAEIADAYYQIRYGSEVLPPKMISQIGRDLNRLEGKHLSD